MLCNNVSILPHAALNQTFWVSDRKTIWIIRPLRVREFGRFAHFIETVFTSVKELSIENPQEIEIVKVQGA